MRICRINAPPSTGAERGGNGTASMICQKRSTRCSKTGTIASPESFRAVATIHSPPRLAGPALTIFHPGVTTRSFSNPNASDAQAKPPAPSTLPVTIPSRLIAETEELPRDRTKVPTEACVPRHRIAGRLTGVIDADEA